MRHGLAEPDDTEAERLHQRIDGGLLFAFGVAALHLTSRIYRE
jgi:hypothetical protein